MAFATVLKSVCLDVLFKVSEWDCYCVEVGFAEVLSFAVPFKMGFATMLKSVYLDILFKVSEWDCYHGEVGFAEVLSFAVPLKMGFATMLKSFSSEMSSQDLSTILSMVLSLIF
jgi:hypothetical protein